MATVIFYEKPGCINNTRQKKLLQTAGHQVDERNLLTHPWDTVSLSRFLHPETRDSWLNSTHPGLKSGDLKLNLNRPDEVLAAMCHDPLLIRRPLLEIDGHCLQGFDAALLDQLIGLSVMPDGDIETCPRSQHATACQ